VLAIVTPASGDGLCHIALNFQGASQSSKDLVPLAVLSTLLGGGDSFSSGGPGKGMTSKLYENVLNRHHYVASALATHFMYGTAGMFTLKGSCDPSAAGQLAAVLAKELKDCVDKVDSAQLERARNATASIVLINNEHGAINAEDMGRQVTAQCFPPHFRRNLGKQLPRPTQQMFSHSLRLSGYVHWRPHHARAAACAS
jgi:processing peptidase subunit alpha